MDILAHLSQIVTWIKNGYELLKKIASGVGTLVYHIGSFFATIAATLIAVIVFVFDIAQKILDVISGQGTVGAYAAATVTGAAGANSIQFPELTSEVGAIGVTWLGLMHQFIPAQAIWDSTIALFAVFIFAFAVRTIKAWIPTMT